MGLNIWDLRLILKFIWKWLSENHKVIGISEVFVVTPWFLIMQKAIIVECKFCKCLVFASWKTRTKKLNFLITVITNTILASLETKKLFVFYRESLLYKGKCAIELDIFHLIISVLLFKITGSLFCNSTILPLENKNYNNYKMEIVIT